MNISEKNNSKTELNNVIKCIFGTNGEYFPEFGGLRNVFCRGIFFAYYESHKEIKTDTIQKYINGTSPFPLKLKSYYTTTAGTEHLRQGVQRLVDACMCMGRLRTIQTNLHTYIVHCDSIDYSLKQPIITHYVPDNASRSQIATYLTCVLIAILPLI